MICYSYVLLRYIYLMMKNYITSLSFEKKTAAGLSHEIIYSCTLVYSHINHQKTNNNFKCLITNSICINKYFSFEEQKNNKDYLCRQINCSCNLVTNFIINNKMKKIKITNNCNFKIIVYYFYSISNK